MASTPPPAGWYGDPERGGGLRYWDGTAWTEHRHDPPAADQHPFWSALELWVQTAAQRIFYAGTAARVYDPHGKLLAHTDGPWLRDPLGSALLHAPMVRLGWAKGVALDVQHPTGASYGLVRVKSWSQLLGQLSVRLDIAGQAELSIKDAGEVRRADGAILARIERTARYGGLSEDVENFRVVRAPLEGPMLPLVLATCVWFDGLREYAIRSSRRAAGPSSGFPS